MRILSLILLLSLVGLFNHTSTPVSAAQQEPPADAAPSYAELLENSDLWPHRVELTKPVELSDPPKVLRPGWSGILMRIEEDGAVIDFGRHGTHSIEVSSTDTLLQASRIKSGEVKRADLFVRRMFNKFYVADPGSYGTYRPSVHQDFTGFDTFLLVWADLGSVASGPAISWVLRERERLEHLRCRPLLFPLDPTEKELLADAKSLGWKDPTCYHWTLPGHRKSLALEPISDPTFFLIDRNGKVLDRGSDVAFLEGLDIPHAAVGP
jgi:hypothetical protein